MMNYQRAGHVNGDLFKFYGPLLGACEDVHFKFDIQVDHDNSLTSTPKEGGQGHVIICLNFGKLVTLP